MTDTKMIIVPFEIGLAKKIINKEIEGRIYDTYYKCPARIVDFNFQTTQGKFNVVISEIEKGKERFALCNDDGIIYLDREGKFDEKPVFKLEIPEYVTFKDGDVLSYDSGTFILKRIDDKDSIEYYANFYGLDVAFDSACLMGNIVSQLRLATEEEKQELIDELNKSENPKAKECLKKLGIEQKLECKFKPKDWILCRCGKNDEWILCQFSHIHKGKKEYVSVNGLFWYIAIPYNEQTAHLLGTNKDWEE